MNTIKTNILHCHVFAHYTKHLVELKHYICVPLPSGDLGGEVELDVGVRWCMSLGLVSRRVSS